MIYSLPMVALDTATTATSSSDMMGSLYSVGLLVLMFVALYFLFIRPQRKRDKELKKQMETLSVGDKIATIGGMVGYVANIKDDEVTISTSAANTLVTFTKCSIQTVVKRESLNADGTVRKAPESEKKSLFGKKAPDSEKKSGSGKKNDIE